jgi:hypothetical protein
MGDAYDDASVVTTESEAEDAMAGIGASGNGKKQSGESGGGGTANKKLSSSAGHGSDSAEDYTDDEDEGESGYKPGGYHPVKIGEVYNQRYVHLAYEYTIIFPSLYECIQHSSYQLLHFSVQKICHH